MASAFFLDGLYDPSLFFGSAPLPGAALAENLAAYQIISNPTLTAPKAPTISQPAFVPNTFPIFDPDSPFTSPPVAPFRDIGLKTRLKGVGEAGGFLTSPVVHGRNSIPQIGSPAVSIHDDEGSLYSDQGIIGSNSGLGVDLVTEITPGLKVYSVPIEKSKFNGGTESGSMLPYPEHMPTVTLGRGKNRYFINQPAVPVVSPPLSPPVVKRKPKRHLSIQVPPVPSLPSTPKRVAAATYSSNHFNEPLTPISALPPIDPALLAELDLGFEQPPRVPWPSPVNAENVTPPAVDPSMPFSFDELASLGLVEGGVLDNGNFGLYRNDSNGLDNYNGSVSSTDSEFPLYGLQTPLLAPSCLSSPATSYHSSCHSPLSDVSIEDLLNIAAEDSRLRRTHFNPAADYLQGQALPPLDDYLEVTPFNPLGDIQGFVNLSNPLAHLPGLHNLSDSIYNRPIHYGGGSMRGLSGMHAPHLQTNLSTGLEGYESPSSTSTITHTTRSSRKRSREDEDESSDYREDSSEDGGEEDEEYRPRGDSGPKKKARVMSGLPAKRLRPGPKPKTSRRQVSGQRSAEQTPAEILAEALKHVGAETVDTVSDGEDGEVHVNGVTKEAIKNLYAPVAADRSGETKVQMFNEGM